MLRKVIWKIWTDFRGRGGREGERVKGGKFLLKHVCAETFGQINHPKRAVKSLEEDGCKGK